ncbi:MAG: hypothetical protein V9E83_12560 [Baekduia sp.]
MISVIATTAVFGAVAGLALRHGADSRIHIADTHRDDHRSDW